MPSMKIIHQIYRTRHHPPPPQEKELVHCVQLEPVTPPNVHNTIVLAAVHQSPSNHGTKKMSPGYGPRRGSKSTGYGSIRRSEVHRMHFQFNWREARLTNIEIMQFKCVILFSYSIPCIYLLFIFN